MSSKKIVILYGSETGNACDYAYILSQKLNRLHFKHTICPLGDFIPSDVLECRYMFIICSTSGQGELPVNARKSSSATEQQSLWSFLKQKSLPHDLLNHLKVSFLGLGDSSYPHFNYAVRKLHERFVNQLGAIELFDRLEADEISMAGSNKGTGSGVESVYFEFERRILKLLSEKFPTRLVNGERIKRIAIDDEIYMEPSSYLMLDDELDMETSSTKPVKFKGDSSVKYGEVSKNLRITNNEHFQDVRQFTIKMKDNENYNPGDTIALYPCNTDEDVEKILKVQPEWLKVADKPLKFSNGVQNNLLEGGVIVPLTLRNLLNYQCDIMSVPRVSFFMKVWPFAVDKSRLEKGQDQLDQQREKLHQFAVDEDMQDLFDYCNRPRRSILEVVEDFLSLNLPWKYILDYMPIIKPRLFSISSGDSDPSIDLTIAIVKYKTILRKIRKGVCTNFVANLKIGDELRYKIHRNNLLDKVNCKSPFILISPGVGIAPMMSLIKSNISGNIHLFFGNRFKDSDYLYQETLEEWEKSGKINLYTAFSRDRVNSPDVKYVQDVLWKKGQELTEIIINENANIYLCGSSGKMPIQVRLTIVEMLKKWGSFADDKEAEAYLKKMEADHRYLQETW
ncbi:hypothetical protein Kpol_264p8 [Vanderwaltozyma polyspora DSM 70294]|uniref:NADPH-dependent diflavin oxidoreductase 1 n=1 Tax=Vanderwaltozyma polyspora (strain ATCC 22028 / DSM 70294 / BCRC 21397 / CBS 2163 / NBRC 10782 / NRRL Y-8283 / UCD 57-17) TaxID=436907 RepID=A7TSZ1_VANPO|nr:uncharacterized protein Kpol_264p8 [Vanderwaltozyma polyspora DSM 70294]EDO14622.1 hypothetical protein Kpol_264p8 [Vanderwaltozyma polyspora DSM 70294]